MGWKNIKEAFSIEHQVAVRGEKITVGSGYLPELIKIDTATGEVTAGEGFQHFIDEHYPSLTSASKEYILELIQSPDTFESNVVVYTYDDDGIIEKLCEKPGYPNVTHDGCMMYENTYSTDRGEVLVWAKENNRLAIEMTRSAIEKYEAEIADLKKDLERFQKAKENLEKQ